MIQQWESLGQIFSGNSFNKYFTSHASNPVPFRVNGNILRIFFNARDNNNRARIFYVHLEIQGRQFEITEIVKKPILKLGDLGSFDDNGMSVGCLIDTGKEIYLYYLGWNLGVSVPFRNEIGLAVSSDGKSFEKYSAGPILSRDKIDHYSLSYPFVLKENSIYKMWYGSHIKWGQTTDDMLHVIKYAESNDGIDWKKKDIICLDVDDVDYAFSRPMLIKEDGTYKMWYSHRGGKYSIGYAESADGKIWQRMDNLMQWNTIPGNWESNMRCYPYIFDLQDRRYMLYNGNRYGKTGFGLAILNSES